MFDFIELDEETLERGRRTVLGAMFKELGRHNILNPDTKMPNLVMALFKTFQAGDKAQTDFENEEVNKRGVPKEKIIFGVDLTAILASALAARIEGCTRATDLDKIWHPYTQAGELIMAFGNMMKVSQGLDAITDIFYDLEISSYQVRDILKIIPILAEKRSED